MTGPSPSAAPAPYEERRPHPIAVVTWLLRCIFFVLIVRPVVLVIVGLNVRHRERLPTDGPALLVANHNSHLDTMVMMSLFPLSTLRRIRPVAAADYFLRTPLRAWFSRNIIGIIPIERASRKDGPRRDLLAPVVDALRRREIVIFFPEGTRGVPERLVEFKRGVAKIAEAAPDVPVVPVYLHALGKVLPRGEAVLVPFFADVFVGEALRWRDTTGPFLETLRQRLLETAAEGKFPSWD